MSAFKVFEVESWSLANGRTIRLVQVPLRELDGRDRRGVLEAVWKYGLPAVRVGDVIRLWGRRFKVVNATGFMLEIDAVSKERNKCICHPSKK